MSYRDAATIAAHSRVRALQPAIRAAYFVAWDRCDKPLGLPRDEFVALLEWACGGAATGTEVLDALAAAGCVVSVGEHWFPISPALLDDSEAFTGDVHQAHECDTRTAIEIAREAGVLGEATGEQWRELMDYVARRRMGAVV